MEKDEPTAKGGRREEPASNGIWQDARFRHLVTDPRFKSLHKKTRKVKIDKRFEGMFTDQRFQVKYTVDKYGRKVNKSNAEDLRKYYEMDTSSSDGEEVQSEAKERRQEEMAISHDAMKRTAAPADNETLNSDGEEVTKTLKERLLDPNIDYARGEGHLLTDSSSDDESSEEDENEHELYLDHVWGELDAQADTTEEATSRLAVCNMDWDRIRAADLMVLLNSFLPPGGIVHYVKIYASEYGKARIAEEEKTGPQELVGLGRHDRGSDASSLDSVCSDEEDLVREEDSDAGEGEDYHMEKLRQYQLNRLRYFYAVAEFDSVQTADKVYKECDGIEYESSATRVDLRFISEDTFFEEDVPTDTCTELPDTTTYKPRQFTTTALQQAKVELTWDETAVERRELGYRLASGRLEDVQESELKKIVTFSSGEDDESGLEEVEPQEMMVKAGENKKDSGNEGKMKKRDAGIEKYRALLNEINEKEKEEKSKKYEMELTWDVNEFNKPEEKAEDEEKDRHTHALSELTPIERVVKKRKEKNKKRKEERKKRKHDGGANDASDSDSDSLPDGFDLNDPYFAEEFANGDFADPKARKKEKQKQKQQRLKEVAKEKEEQAKELQLLLDDDDVGNQGKQHFSLTKILKTEQETKSGKKRRKQLKKSKSAIVEEKKQVEDNFRVNIEDDRFKSLYTSHHFNIDPTDSHFRKTKAMDEIIQEKLKRRHGGEGETSSQADGGKRPKSQIENALLVKSLKRKIQMKQ